MTWQRNTSNDIVILHSYNPQVQRCKPLYSFQTVYHICLTRYKIIKPCKSNFEINNSNIIRSHQVQKPPSNCIKLRRLLPYRSHQYFSKTISIYNRSISPTIGLFLLINSNDTLNSTNLPTSNALIKKNIIYKGVGSPPVMTSPVLSCFYTNERHMASNKS